jgi:uncharacterized protein (TIGR00369 family)
MPLADLIGFEVGTFGASRAITTLETGPQHFNPMGTLHGGIICDIADAAMGFAVGSTLARGQSFTTIGLKINYFRPATKLTAEANVVQRGKTTAYIECTDKDQADKLVAKAVSTCMIPPWRPRPRPLSHASTRPRPRNHSNPARSERSQPKPASHSRFPQIIEF